MELIHTLWRDQIRFHGVSFYLFWLIAWNTISFVHALKTNREARSSSLLDRCIYISFFFYKDLSYDKQGHPKYFSFNFKKGYGAEIGNNFLNSFLKISKYHHPNGILLIQYSASRSAREGWWFSYERIDSFYTVDTITYSFSALPYISV